MSGAILPSTLLDGLNWRYATKRMDSSKTIASETWAALEQALILAPSSYGLQPWTFVVVTDPAVKAALRPHAWNQPQITECSHLVVFAVKKNLGAEHIEKHLQRMSEVRGVPLSALDGFRGMLLGDVVDGPRSLIVNQWAQRQLYIALGVLLTSAALLRVDACPMEGFDPAGFDKVLDLPKLGLSATVLCALGYRSAEDKTTGTAKVRFEAKDVVLRK